MPHTAILVPVFVLAGWTGLVLGYLAARRVTAGIAPREFALGESGRTPRAAVLANRNYMNLLELPVLFYVASLMAATLPVLPGAAVTLAWAYVMLRVVHSLVHLTYNHVMHRFIAFVISNLVLAALWVVVGRAVFGAPA